MKYAGHIIKERDCKKKWNPAITAWYHMIIKRKRDRPPNRWTNEIIITVRPQ